VSTNDIPKNPKKYAKQQLHSTIMGKNILVNGLGLAPVCEAESR
jgi:MOSC domain-containing protein YiiM